LRRRRIRTRSRELSAALTAALILGGCGSGDERAAPPPPRLPASLASGLASRSDVVAQRLDANDGCGALAAAKRLQQQTIAAVNARRVPPRFQEPLLGAANDLVLRIHCAPPPTPAAGGGDEHGKGKDKGKGHGKGKGKHGGGEG
jgi:hypothetical protein